MEIRVVMDILLPALVALVVGYVAARVIDKMRKRDAEEERKRILDQAESEAGNVVRDAKHAAKEASLNARIEAEKELNSIRDELRDQSHAQEKEQNGLKQQAEDLRKQEKIVEGTQRRLAGKLEDVNRRSDELTGLLDMQRQSLHEVTGMGKEEATTRLLELLDQELQNETGARILSHEKKVAETCDLQARDMLLTALHRYASAHTAESTTSTVDIPSDDMKGRIIGREGRNIRAFEKATGIDVIIDDTPGVVIVSGFDPVRREIGRQAMNKLIADGRIHPSRIEEVVKETEKEIEKFIRRKGEEAAQEVNVQGLHERVIYMLGRMHFRTSYSQNVLRHSVEVSFLTGMMAEMIGLDGEVGRRSGGSAPRATRTRDFGIHGGAPGGAPRF